jgi:hypothetical protein
VSWNGADGSETGALEHPAARLVLEYAERDRLRRERETTSPTTAATHVGPGPPGRGACGRGHDRAALRPWRVA